MLLASFPAGPLAANCYLVAADSHSDCVIIDPGMDSADQIGKIVAAHDLSPVAVLLTHGHFDHAASAALVADRYQAGCWVGCADQGQLADPLSGLSAEFRPLVTELLDDAELSLPSTLLELALGPVRLAGLDFQLIPAPGHTPGSTLIALDYRAAQTAGGDSEDPSTVVFTGDVVFAGSIGRTDLPGGDRAAMERTLTEVVLGLPEDAVLLPGHGPQTTLRRERAANPYLVPLTPA